MNQPENNSNKSVTTNSLAVVLGKQSVGDFPLIQKAGDIPTNTNLIVLDCSAFDLPARILKDIRKVHPDSYLIAWLSVSDDDLFRALAGAGADDVAIGMAQLVFRLKVAERILAFSPTLPASPGFQANLLAIVNEITEKPELQDVLHTSVMRLSNIFSDCRVSILLLDEGNTSGVVVMEQERTIENITIELSKYPEVQEMIRTRDVVVVKDAFNSELMAPVTKALLGARETPHSTVLFPLMRKNRIVGALFLRCKYKIRELEKTLIDAGRFVASVTSVALGSALEQENLQSRHKILVKKQARSDIRLEGMQQILDTFEQARDGILVVDAEGILSYANRAAEGILQQSKHELQEGRLDRILSPEATEVIQHAISGDDVEGLDGYVDLGVQIKNGERIIVSASIGVLKEQNSLLICFRDVTAQRAMESELRKTTGFLENLIQSSAEAIVASDVDGTVILMNPAAEEILGYDADIAVGKICVNDIYRDGQGEEIMRRMRNTAHGSGGKVRAERHNVVAQDGTLVPVNLSAALLYEDGQEVASVGVFTDLREHLEMESRIQQAQSKLQMSERQAVAVELAGAAAHELNQPLTAIQGYSEILKKQITEGDLAQKAVTIISRETERMAGIVRKLGQITSYETRTYVGTSKIMELESKDDIFGSKR